LLLACATLFVAPASLYAQGAETRCTQFGDFTLREGERLDCDLNVLGGNLVIERGAEVSGSANAPVGTAVIAGVTGGDAFALGELTVSGEVHGSAFTLGDLDVSGRIDGDATANGNIRVAGTVGGSVEAFAGGATVAGRVDGDVTARGDVTLADGAIVGRDVQAGGKVDQAAGATVANAVRPNTAGGGWRDPRTAVRTGLAVSMVLFAMLFAGLLVAVAPNAIERVRSAARTGVWASLLAGILALVFAVLLAWLGGIPILAYLVAGALGMVGLSEIVGTRLAPGRSRVAAAALGAGVLAGVAAVGLAFGEMGWGRLCLVLAVFGFVHLWTTGAGVLTVWGTRAWPPPEVEAPLALPGPTGGVDEPADGAPPPVERSPLPPPAAEDPTDLPGEISPPVGFDMPAVSLDAPRSGPPAGSTAPGFAQPDIGAPHAPAPAALRQVAGITPIYARLLQEAGIGTVAGLAATTPERLMEILASSGVAPISRATADQWLASAKSLLDA